MKTITGAQVKIWSQFADACAKDLAASTVPAEGTIEAKPMSTIRRNALETLTKLVDEMKLAASPEPSA